MGENFRNKSQTIQKSSANNNLSLDTKLASMKVQLPKMWEETDGE